MMTTTSKNQNRLAAPGHDFLSAVNNVLSGIDQFVDKNSCIFRIKLFFVNSFVLSCASAQEC